MKTRLDQILVEKGMVSTRSQAESFIRLGKVTVDSKVVQKPGHFVTENAELKVNQDEQYVSRAGMKLASVAGVLGLDFRDKIVLDVGSSTGGFTDFSLRRGAKKVIAVDVGTDQLHPNLQGHPQIELHEKTDIRDVSVNDERVVRLDSAPNIILIDVSFISLREILPHIARHVANKNTVIVAMLKPQFEAGFGQSHKGVIKNDAMRRQILKDFETWVRKSFVIEDKRDSSVSGAKGNRERFYVLGIATR